jgi:putative transposase
MLVRSYPLKHFANESKQKKVKDVLKQYRTFAKQDAKIQWNLFFLTGKFNKNLASLSEVPSLLSERYKQTCQYQVVGILESFTSNIANDFRRIVWRSKLDKETKLQMFYINKHKLWYRQDVTIPLFVNGKRIKGEQVIIDQEIIKLARRIFKNILSKRHKPTFRHINMALDSKVAEVVPKDPNKASDFDYWVRISTLEKGKPVQIPLQTNYYFDSIEGNVLNFCQVNTKENGQLEIRLLKDIPTKNYEVLTQEIRMDWGLVTMFATQFGDLFGRSFFDELKRRDEAITNLAKNRQKQGLKVKSPKYNYLCRSARTYIKNEVNRVLNRIVEVHKPAKIVVEKLDFRNPNLSRRMNRLLSKCGRGVIERKLNSLSEIYGIEIEYINPAYTSQTCSNPKCSYVDKRNRQKQDTFKCKVCGKKLHADVNGSRIIGSRSSTSLGNPNVSREAILHASVEIFLSKLGMERLTSLNSKAVSLIQGNPYFKDYLDEAEGLLSGVG